MTRTRTSSPSKPSSPSARSRRSDRKAPRTSTRHGRRCSRASKPSVSRSRPSPPCASRRRTAAPGSGFLEAEQANQAGLLAKLTAERDRLRSAASAEQGRLTELEANIESLRAERDQLTSSLSALRTRLTAAAGNLTATEQTLAERQQALAERDVTLEAQRGQLAGLAEDVKGPRGHDYPLERRAAGGSGAIAGRGHRAVEGGGAGVRRTRGSARRTDQVPDRGAPAAGG